MIKNSHGGSQMERKEMYMLHHILLANSRSDGKPSHKTQLV